MINPIHDARLYALLHPFSQQGFQILSDIMPDPHQHIGTVAQALHDAQEPKEDWQQDSHRTDDVTIQQRVRVYICTKGIPIVQLTAVLTYGIIKSDVFPDPGSYEYIFTAMRDDEVECLQSPRIFAGTIAEDDGAWLDLIVFIEALFNEFRDMWPDIRPPVRPFNPLRDLFGED